MNDFTLYFQMGIQHILTWDAMDHILFVAALCLRYLWQDWRKVVVLVTAFTIGHSVTLALSALKYVHFSRDWIEFFIPLTIAATCINNIVQSREKPVKRLPVIYFFALFFGLIHGLAFAGQFLSLEGKEGLVEHLLAFNLGIEVAQLVVVAIALFFSFVVVQQAKVSRLIWLKGASIIILIISLAWAYQRFPYTKNLHDEKTTAFHGNRFVNVKLLLGTKHSEQSRGKPWQQIRTAGYYIAHS